MGWGAAYALAEEWSDWCSGPEEAYEILYGGRERRGSKPQKVNKPHGPLRECPKCTKLCKGTRGLIDHLKFKHKMSGQDADLLVHPRNDRSASDE